MLDAMGLQPDVLSLEAEAPGATSQAPSRMTSHPLVCQGGAETYFEPNSAGTDCTQASSRIARATDCTIQSRGSRQIQTSNVAGHRDETGQIRPQFGFAFDSASIRGEKVIAK